MELVDVVARRARDKPNLETMIYLRKRVGRIGPSASRKLELEEKDWTNCERRPGLERPRARMSHGSPEHRPKTAKLGRVMRLSLFPSHGH
jgi:hypothetical protein